MDVDLRTLIEPAAVVVHAVKKAREIFNFKHGSYVLVQGCGPIGLLLLTTVRTMGVRNIIAVDGDGNRLTFPRRTGSIQYGYKPRAWQYDISKVNIPTLLTAGTGTFDAGNSR